MLSLTTDDVSSGSFNLSGSIARQVRFLFPCVALSKVLGLTILETDISTLSRKDYGLGAGTFRINRLALTKRF